VEPTAGTIAWFHCPLKRGSTRPFGMQCISGGLFFKKGGIV
jgi:hypothetical protein